MEPIADLSWLAQLAGGALERFELRGFAVAAVGAVPPRASDAAGQRRSGRGGTYRFRLLFSPPSDRRPVYAVNLESSILGDWLLTEQIGTSHRVVEHLAAPLSYEEFRIRALELALIRLEPANPAAELSGGPA